MSIPRTMNSQDTLSKHIMLKECVPARIASVRFGLASPDEVVKMAELEVRV